MTHTPYGAPRGTAPASWPDTNGFLGKPTDPTTGLTIVGARQYDPTTGLFLSIDPILETTSPQDLNGYSYAAGNPVTDSDPTGLMRVGPCGEGDCSPHPPGNGNHRGGGNKHGHAGSGRRSPPLVCVIDRASPACWPIPAQTNENTREQPLNDLQRTGSLCSVTFLGFACPSLTTSDTPEESAKSAASAENDGIDKLAADVARAGADAAARAATARRLSLMERIPISIRRCLIAGFAVIATEVGNGGGHSDGVDLRTRPPAGAIENIQYRPAATGPPGASWSGGDGGC